MTTSFRQLAKKLADKVRSTGLGFLTLSKEELKSEFLIKKLNELAVQEIVRTLGKDAILVYPRPDPQVLTLRLYDLRHDIGRAAKAVLSADVVPDDPLRTVAKAVQRLEDGKALRSKDVPWLDAFGIWLEVISGREPDEWEDLNDDRHPAELAQSLATSLGISPELIEAEWVIALATVCSAWRSPRRLLEHSAFRNAGIETKSISRFVRAQESRADRANADREALLRSAVPLFLGGVDAPKSRVELGQLGLRLRRDHV